MSYSPMAIVQWVEAHYILSTAYERQNPALPFSCHGPFPDWKQVPIYYCWVVFFSCWPIGIQTFDLFAKAIDLLC